MRAKTLKGLILIFIFLLLVFLVKSNLSKPRVFILHSYDLDYSWVRDINVGLSRIFKKRPYSFRWHYMDTKRHPSKKFKELAGENARKMVEAWNPDVLLAIDDNAQQYVAKYFNNDPSIKIIFTGVNANIKVYGYDKAKNVTGMLERIPFKEFKEVFLQLLPPDKRRVVHISDNSTSSHFIHQELEEVDWAPLELVASFRCDTFDQWKKAIKNADKIGDVILMTHYHTIKEKITDKKIIMPRKIIKWTEPNLKLPTIGCWGFYVEDGGTLAVAVSPYEQGEEAAKMAVDIIEKDVDPSRIPIMTSVQYVVYIREQGLKKLKVSLPKMLEAFARATNHYYEIENK